MESNRVIAGTIGLFVVICLVGAVLAPMINDWATGERITNEGAGWLRMDYTEVTESSNYSMAVSLAGGTITVTDTNSATQSGADDTIAYASSNLAIWTDNGTIQILGTDPDGNSYHATASSSVNVWYTQVLGQIIKIDGSEDAITFDTPTWAYLPLTNGNYAFFDNGTSVQTEEGKPLAVVSSRFASVYAYNNIVRYGLPLTMETTQDTDGLLNGAHWDKASEQDQRQLNPISLDPGLIRVNPDEDPEPEVSVRSVPTPTYTDGDWGYDIDGLGLVNIVSYTGSAGDIVIPATVGGNAVSFIGKGTSGSNIFPTSLGASTVTITPGPTKILASAFQGFTGMTSVSIPDTVTEIGNNAFNGSGLKQITLPNSITTLGSGAFQNCTALESITFSTALTSTSVECFRACSHLKSIVVPDTITTLSAYSFHSTGISSAVIMGESTTIGANCFTSCASLQNLVIMSNQTPTTNSFYNCTLVSEVMNLGTVTYAGGSYGLPADITVQDSIDEAFGYISFVEKGSDPLVPAGAAAVMLAIPVVILGALIVVAATTFIRKE